MSVLQQRLSEALWNWGLLQIKLKARALLIRSCFVSLHVAPKYIRSNSLPLLTASFVVLFIMINWVVALWMMRRRRGWLWPFPSVFERVRSVGWWWTVANELRKFGQYVRISWTLSLFSPFSSWLRTPCAQHTASSSTMLWLVYS